MRVGIAVTNDQFGLNPGTCGTCNCPAGGNFTCGTRSASVVDFCWMTKFCGTCPWEEKKKKYNDDNNDNNDEEEDLGNVLDDNAEQDAMSEPEREDEVQVHDDDDEDGNDKEEEKDADDGSEVTIVDWFLCLLVTAGWTHRCSKNWEGTSKAMESIATTWAHTISWEGKLCFMDELIADDNSAAQAACSWNSAAIKAKCPTFRSNLAKSCMNEREEERMNS